MRVVRGKTETIMTSSSLSTYQELSLFFEFRSFYFSFSILDDLETYFNRLADEAEEGLSNNQLKGAYRAIKQSSGEGLSKPAVSNQQSGWPAMRLKGRDPREVAGALRNDAQPPACNGLPRPRPGCSRGQ